MQAVSQLYTELNSPKKVVVTMHQKPDGDAMGSTLGLYHFLVQFGHRVRVVSPTNWATFLDWMPGCHDVLDFEKQTNEAEQLVLEAQLIFCLDFNTMSRTKSMESCLLNAPATKILIDHHQQPQLPVFSYGISDTSKSSTAEMIYDFICLTGFQDKINDAIAQCLYAGVMTDTGSFRFPSTSASVHWMVADLLKRGLHQSVIHEQLFDHFSENRLRFIGHVLLNRMEVFYEYNTALISVPMSDLVKYDIKTGDTEGLVNYTLSIEGIKLAAIIIDRGEERRCSFRSKGNFDVNSFARKYFNGGGHFHAAGGSSKDAFEKVVADFKKAMTENKTELSSYQF